MNDLTVFAATFEITQDALREYKTVHFDVFLLNIHRFKLRKCSKTKIILFLADRFINLLCNQRNKSPVAD